VTIVDRVINRVLRARQGGAGLWAACLRGCASTGVG